MTLKRVSIFSIAFLFVFSFAFTQKANAQTPPTTSSSTPIVIYFTASPNTISPGGQTTLSWAASFNSVSCSLGSPLYLNGRSTIDSISVAPTQTTTYSLTCANSSGVSQPSTATVTVTGSTSSSCANGAIYDTNTGILCSGITPTTNTASTPNSSINIYGTGQQLLPAGYTEVYTQHNYNKTWHVFYSTTAHNWVTKKTDDATGALDWAHGPIADVSTLGNNQNCGLIDSESNRNGCIGTSIAGSIKALTAEFPIPKTSGNTSTIVQVIPGRIATYQIVYVPSIGTWSSMKIQNNQTTWTHPNLTAGGLASECNFIESDNQSGTLVSSLTPIINTYISTLTIGGLTFPIIGPSGLAIGASNTTLLPSGGIDQVSVNNCAYNSVINAYGVKDTTTTTTTTTTTNTATAAPTITSFSANPATVNPGQVTTLVWWTSYVPAATGCVLSGGNAPSTVMGPATSFTITPNQTTTYSLVCSNSAGSSAPSTATVTVGSPSTTATPNSTPIITLNGPTTMSVPLGTTFTAPTATANDINNTDISGSVVITGSVPKDTNGLTTTIGSFPLYYNVTDPYGIKAPTITLTVKVVSSSNTTNKFQIGDTVKTTAVLNVRSKANGSLLGKQAINSYGTVIGGPTVAGGYTWWNINFDKQPDGWSVEKYLVKATRPLTPTTASVPIATIIANPTTITAGQSSTLTWSSTNVTSCVGLGNSGTSGTIVVSPAQTTTYSITCVSGDQAILATATVTVNGVTPPVTTTLNPFTDPNYSQTSTVQLSGAEKTVTYQYPTAPCGTLMTQFATVGSVSVGNGPVLTLATQVAAGFGGTPDINSFRTYSCQNVLVGTSIQGKATFAFKIIPGPVTPATSAVPTNVTITATPANVTYLGMPVTLTIASKNALTCNITGGTSPIIPTFTNGSLNITPTQTTTYTLICSNTSGPSLPATATVNFPLTPTDLVSPLAITSFSVSPTSITLGQPLTFSWVATGAVGCNINYQPNSTGVQYGLASVNGNSGTYLLASGGYGYPAGIGNTSYFLVCGNPQTSSTSVQKSVVVNVNGTTSQVPNILLFSSVYTGIAGVINPAITWSATNNPTSCTASGDWTGTKPASGTLQLGVLTTVKTYTYNLICSNSFGSSIPMATTVTVTPPNNNSAPTISSISPNTVPAGGTVTVYGSNFDQNTQVDLAYQSGTLITPTLISSNALSFVVPLNSIPSSAFGGLPYIVVVGEIGSSYTSQNSNFNTADLTVTSALPPSINYFTNNPPSISVGQQSVLSWSSTNATGCTLSGGTTSFPAEPPIGTTPVTPTQTTNYSIICSGPGGSTSQALAVLVTPSTTSTCATGATYDTATGQLCSSGTGTPTASISVNPTSITVGQTATLTWSSTNASSCSEFIGNSTGSLSIQTSSAGLSSAYTTIQPTQTVTYTLICKNGAGVSSSPATATLTVNPAPPVNPTSPVAPVISASANPTSITVGQSTTITWSSTNATSCSGLGSAATSGSLTVGPSQTTSYTITCSGAGGSASQSVSINVTPTNATTCANGAVYNTATGALCPTTVPLPLAITSFTAGTSSGIAGQPVTLTWTSTGAYSCNMGGTSGSAVVYPPSTTTYTLTCYDTAGHLVTASVTVSAQSTGSGGGPMPTNNMSVAPTDNTTQMASVAQGLQNLLDALTAYLKGQ